jgi:uroporphyrinogen decarboxylase
MNSRETVLDAITSGKGKKRPRIPVSLLSGGTWTFRQKGLDLKDILDDPDCAAPIITGVNSHDVHSDIVWPGSGYHNIPAHIFGGQLKFRPHGNIDVVEPAFRSLSDIDTADAGLIDKHPWIVAIRSVIRQVNDLAGKEFLVGTSAWGPFTLAGQFYGVEKLMSGLYKDKTGIHALLEFITEVCYRYLSPAIGQGALLLSVAEPTASGDLISLRHFEEFVAPYLKQLIQRLKQDGALITLHICGNIQDRLGLAPELGVDLLSVDYKVDLAAAAGVLDGRVALAGNLNPVTLKDSPPEEVIAKTRAILETAGDYSRFILMPGCDIPPAVPLANLQAFFRTGLSWKATA